MTCPLYKRVGSGFGGDERVNFGYDERDYEGLWVRDWFDLHHKRFLLPLEEIAAQRVPYQRDIHCAEGVYFLFEQDVLQYVGKSVHIAARLQKHAFPKYGCKQVPWITHYAAIWVPSALLDTVEGYYIHTLRPPRNEQYRNPCLWAVPYIK